MAITQINGAYQIKAASIPASVLNLTLDEITAPAASLDLNSQKIINLATPTSDTDAATKAYVDTAVTGLLEYKGVIDCSTNPDYPAAEVGDLYVVSVAGKIGGASGVNVTAGDSIICKEDNSGGDQATVGSDFNIIEGNLDGAVVGPASSTDTAVALFDGTSGKVIKNSSVTVDGSGNIATSGSIGSDGSRLAKGWFTDLEVSNAIAGSITGNAATVTTNANLTGDVTSVGNATTIADEAVTLAKIANAAANSKLLGSGAAGADSSYSEISLGTGLSMSGTTLNASAAPSFADSEIPSGTINGTNTDFDIANTPVSGSVKVYLNGVRQEAGATEDYTISGTTISFATAPLSGDKILTDYRY
jgi:hypothetical protein